MAQSSEIQSPLGIFTAPQSEPEVFEGCPLSQSWKLKGVPSIQVQFPGVSKSLAPIQKSLESLSVNLEAADSEKVISISMNVEFATYEQQGSYRGSDELKPSVHPNQCNSPPR